MIDINLLPVELRPGIKESRAWIPAAVLCVLALVCTVFGIVRYRTSVIPGLEARAAELEEKSRALTAEAGQTLFINTRIDELERYVNAVTSLYEERPMWARLLQDVKEVVTTASSGDGSVWLTRLAGYGKLVTLDGYAVAGDRDDARETAEKLAQDLAGHMPYGNGAPGVTSAPLKDLLAEGWPRVKRTDAVPLPESYRRAWPEAGERAAVAFTIEMRLK